MSYSRDRTLYLALSHYNNTGPNCRYAINGYFGVSECSPMFHCVSGIHHVVMTKFRLKKCGISENHGVSRKLWCIKDILLFEQ